MNEHKRAVIYCRVSTDEQADKGYSLPTQLEACERYANDHALEIVGHFRDDYTGAVPLETRPEGKKAYDLLRNRGADVLIAYRIDRIVRPPEDGDEWEMPILIRGLAKLNKEIHVCNRGELKTDFASLLIAMLDARKAGEERRDIVERTTRGRNRKAQEGKVIGCGHPPYGYMFDKDQLAIQETEASIVRMIYHWYTVGDENLVPLTEYSITHKLSKMGIPTPGEGKGMFRIRSAGMWAFCTVHRILTNETYAGVLRFGRMGSYNKGEKRPTRAKEDLFTIPVPAIVSREVWDEAQKRREYNKAASGRNNTRHNYLLHGLIRCGCGRTMVAKLANPCRYRCNSDRTYLAGLEDDQRCKEPIVNGEVLEAAVWNYVRDLLCDAARFELEWRKAQKAEQDELQPKRERLGLVVDLIRQCEKDAEEAVTALKQAKGIVLAKLQTEIDNIDHRYTHLITERDRIIADLQQAAKFDDDTLARALHFRQDIVTGLKEPTFEDKRNYLEMLRIAVTVKDRKAAIRCALPIDPVDFDFHSF